jgi:Tol biopolymer transport system component
MNSNRTTKEVYIYTSVAVTILLAAVGSARADFVFGNPTNLGPSINTSSNEGLPMISLDGLSLYFSSGRSGGYGKNDIWVAMRPSTEDEWGPATNLGPRVNSDDIDLWPCISADGLTLTFYSIRSGGYGNGDIWQTTRPTLDDEWGTPVNLGALINSSADDGAACISTDGLELYFNSDRSGDSDLYVSKRASVQDAWSEPVNLGVLNTMYSEAAASLSADGLTLFFQSTRTGGFGNFDLYMTTRKTIDANWSAPVNIGPPVNTPYDEIAPCISMDGNTLYFCDYPWRTPRPGGLGGNDLWQVLVEPIVDFSGDGVVDLVDLVMLIDHWETDNTLYDIGPMPWGDGVVDVEDLKVFIAHWEN